MKNIKHIYEKLERQCPSDYRINEIIPFAYPYRRVKIRATVNKNPEESIQQVYSVFLRSIQAGYGKQEALVGFLGLKQDDFILEELYFLREKGFLDFVSGEWLVTAQGEKYIEDNSILQVLEEEDFEFLIDGINGEIILKDFITYKAFDKSRDQNILKSEFKLPHRSPNLLKGKNEELSDVYKKYSKGEAYLINYDRTKIRFDAAEMADYYLIEYLPIKGKEDEIEPYIEVRKQNKSYLLDKRVTIILSNRYPQIVYQFSDSERQVLKELAEEDEYEVLNDLVTEPRQNVGVQTLTIWETKNQFVQALNTAKKRVLIESPWIKRVTLEYVPLIEEALKRGVVFVVLYGIEDKDEHHTGAIKQMEQLADKYQGMAFIHLPTHFIDKGNHQMTGTHRKLMIKDNEFFIQGSFNFLSFGKKEGQMVANEESILIGDKVSDKWNKVLEEYQLPKDLMKGRK